MTSIYSLGTYQLSCPRSSRSSNGGETNWEIIKISWICLAIAAVWLSFG